MPAQKPADQNLPSGNNTPLILKTILITIVVLLITGGLIYAGFWYGKNKVSIPLKLPNRSPAQSSLMSPVGQPTTGKEVPYGDENLDTDEAYQKAMGEYKDEGPYGWKSYTTKDSKYSFKYPPDWTLTDKSADVDLYNDGNKKFQQNIIISKDNYSFKSYNPLAWGPSVCLYPDSPPFEGPGGGEIEEKYVEVKGINAVYRRPEQSTYDLPSNKLKWGICQKETDSNFFTSVAGFGQIWYETPQNYDPNMLILLDQITASFTTNK